MDWIHGLLFVTDEMMEYCVYIVCVVMVFVFFFIEEKCERMLK